MESPAARILFMEDDVDTRDFVVLEFTNRNWHVTVPESHEDAVRFARAEQFDLYLLDNWMPGISGVGLCEQLREFDQQTPILFYSGAAFEKEIQGALACGAQGYIVKPASGDKLAAEVQRLISESATNGG